LVFIAIGAGLLILIKIHVTVLVTIMMVFEFFFNWTTIAVSLDTWFSHHHDTAFPVPECLIVS
jgi:hypothetical protein